jgi:hypothetical protein
MASPEQVATLASAVNTPSRTLSELERLEPSQINVLREGFLKAQTRQRADMTQAIDAALKHVPALLRGAVLKILRG